MERADCLLLEPPPTPGCTAPALPCAPSSAAACACGDDALTDASPPRDASPAVYLVAYGDEPQPLADGLASSRPTRKRTRIVLSDALLDDDLDDDAPVHETQSCASPKKYRGVWCATSLSRARACAWLWAVFWFFCRRFAMHVCAAAAGRARVLHLTRCCTASRALRRLDKKRNKCVAPTTRKSRTPRAAAVGTARACARHCIARAFVACPQRAASCLFRRAVRVH
jgi:hypothetical protein